MPACKAGDLGLIPGSGRFPGEGNGNPLQYSCLKNPTDRGAWWATVHGRLAKSRTRLSDFTHSSLTYTIIYDWSETFNAHTYPISSLSGHIGTHIALALRPLHLGKVMWLVLATPSIRVLEGEKMGEIPLPSHDGHEYEWGVHLSVTEILKMFVTTALVNLLNMLCGEVVGGFS